MVRTSCIVLLLAVSAFARTYRTSFPANENPLSEAGNWTNGHDAGSRCSGFCWGNAQSNGTLAFGADEPTQYGDPTAIVNGSWGADQVVQGTVKINSTPPNCCHEVEIRVRTTISSGNIDGYEILCPVHSSPGYGFQVVRWNGPNGQFVYLPATGSLTGAHQCVNGDIIKATVTGTNPTTIVVNYNGTDIMTATDNGSAYDGPGGPAGPWTGGSPGIGFFDNIDSNWSNFGLTNFSAADELSGFPLTVTKTGNGTVSSGDRHIYCGDICSYSYIEGSQVSLGALPSPGYTFKSWMGCDNVNGGFCSVTMTGAKNVKAAFDVANVTLTSLPIRPTYVRGGQIATGTLTLSATAPPGGMTVSLNSDHPGVAHPPSFVFVPGGQASVGFAVRTFPVKEKTIVVIKATASRSQVSGTLTVGTSFFPTSLQ